MRTTLKWLRRVIAALLICTVFVLGLVAILLNTETGSRFVINRIVAAVPVSLEFERISGTLWRGLAIGRFAYRDDGRILGATDANLVIDWPAVTLGNIALEEVRLDAFSYRSLAEVDEAPEPLSIDMPPLPVSIQVDSLRASAVTLTFGDAETAITDVDARSVSFRDRDLSFASIALATQTIDITVSGFSIRFTGDVPVRAEVAWSQANSEWSGRGQLNGSLRRLGFSHTLAGPYAAEAVGSVLLLGRTEPGIDAGVRWRRWSFGDVVVRDGNLRVRGTAADYNANGAFAMTLPDGRELGVEGNAAGNLERIEALDIDVRTTAGLASLTGNIAWFPALTANASVRLENVDPSTFVPQLPGNLSGSTEFEMRGTEFFSFSGTALTGRLRDAPVRLSGSLAWTPERIDCARCVVDVGENRLEFDGSYGSEAFGADFAIAATDLALLWPDIGGSLAGSGRLDGTLNAPRLRGQLDGADLRFADWAADELKLVSRSVATTDIDMTLALSGLRRGENDLGSITGLVGGSAERLTLDTEWNVREVYVRVSTVLEPSEQGLYGTIGSGLVVEPTTGAWSLDAPFAYRRDGTGLHVDAHRWSGEDGALTVNRIEVGDTAIDIDASATTLPIRLINLYLPEGYELSGNAEVLADVSYGDGTWSGALAWRQSDSILTVPETAGQAASVSIPTLDISTTLADGGARTSAAIAIDPGVRGDLSFTLDRLSNDAQIDGRFVLQGDDWDWVSAIAPSIDAFEGQVGADIRAAGAMLAPEFSGTLTWKEGRLEVPAVNVPISEIDVEISGASSGAATLRGRAIAGGGPLEINGRFDELMLPSRYVEIEVRGEEAQLVNWTDYQVWASPDLRLRGDADGWSFGGELTVPRAEFSIRELPEGAVRPSDDVIVVGEEETDSAPTPYSGDARLILGERVHVQAFGLDTRLEGDLRVRKLRDRPLAAEGQVRLVDGVFVAYGQRLTIESGTLTFTGPLDNPLVDVRAVRVIEDFDSRVTAGIQLRGRANNLSSTVFSTPAMGEADALSYLVLGRPLNQATESEGNELSGAAVALGVRQAARITQQIGQSLGLDQLTIAGDGGDATALIAGKQVNKRLYARYAYGVFSRLGTLLLRYRLSNRLTLEAGAGEVQSIDVLYTVESE